MKKKDNKKICVIGDAFFDVFVPVGELEQGGSFVRNILTCPGGTANIAVWARRLGIESCFIGKIGSDVFGLMFRKDLEKERVCDLTMRDTAHATGICVSLIDTNGERTMVTSRGANDCWTLHEMEHLLLSIHSSYIVFVTGYSMICETNATVLEVVMNRIRAKGCEIWFNPGAENIIDDRVSDFIRKFVDFLILNEVEANKLAGGLFTNPDVLMNNYSCKGVIITSGKNGSISATRDGIVMKHAATVPELVDTTGAGDAFAAGVAAGWLRGLQLDECLSLGHDTAAKVIQKVGAR
ncbi:carbohydrate kinase family protein [Chloroflexota bacterium]